MKIISVSSGKGGVGKTTMTCNLAMSLAEQNQKVLILDGDLGMANVDIFFGLRPQKSIEDLVNGENIKNCITAAVKNIDILAGGSGSYSLTQLSAFQRREVINQVHELKFNYDFVLIDTAPGLHDYVLHLNSIADQCLILITEDPSSFADAYALIKVLHQKHKTQDFTIVCNQIEGQKGESVFVRFSDVVENFLNVRLSFLGTIPFDPQLKKIQQMQRLMLRQQNQKSEVLEVFKNFSQTIVNAKNNQIAASTRVVSLSDSMSESLDGIFIPAAGHA